MIDAKAIIDEFEAYLKALNMAKTTIEWERHILGWFFTFLEKGNVNNLTDVTCKIMLKYQMHLSVMVNKKGKPYNSRTQNIAISTVRKLFKYLRRSGQVFKDVQFYRINVSFDGIADEAERQTFKSIPTSFSLPSESVDKLSGVGMTLLSESSEFQRLLRDLRQ
jgi:hypothetical protein